MTTFAAAALMTTAFYRIQLHLTDWNTSLARANPAFNNKSPSHALNILLAPNDILVAMMATRGQMPYAELIGVWALALIVFAIGVKRIEEVE
jgi:hypothetical protein